MINRDRLEQTFKYLVEIDSPSREEGAICAELRQILESFGGTTYVDNAGEKTGSDTGNMIAKFPGTVDAPPFFICGHMDTVEPGRGIRAVLKDGVFTSEGATILGADDKSALAIVLEVLQVIRENDIARCPLEIVFTVCEEVGLLGAKNFDISSLDSKFGYILDSTDTEGIVTRAPAANSLTISIHGRAAHAGAEPEKGISAIAVAGKAISGLTLGRIDEETTCNLGKIEGGVATNIVPDLVRIEGEVRSHDGDKLERVTRDIITAFEKAADEFNNEAGNNSGPGCHVEIHVENDFPNTDISPDHPVVKLAQKAAANLGREMKTKTIGGGADANIFFNKGLAAGVVGTGMRDVHTLKENIRVDDMIKTAELLLEIVRIHSAEK